MQKAKIISIVVADNGDGLFHATSPQMPELFVSGDSEEQTLHRVPEAIEGLYALDGELVRALPAEGSDLPIPTPWVIFDGSLPAASR